VRTYDVKLDDGSHERITAPGKDAAAVAAQQVTGQGVEEVGELPDEPEPGDER
jgi:hypothetical protein